MKKLFSVTLAIVLLVAGFAFAEDYSAMTDEELQAANKAIQAELWARSVAKDGVLIPTGTYIIGEDIPAGKYRVVKQDDIYASYLDLYKDADMEDYDYLAMHEEDPEIGKVDLTGYYALKVDGPATFYAYTGLFN